MNSPTNFVQDWYKANWEKSMEEAAEDLVKRLTTRERCEGCDHLRTQTCHRDCRRDKTDYYMCRQRPKEWSKWPIGSRAYAIMGGYWERVKAGWKWCTGDIFPTPGADVSKVLFPEEVKALQQEEYERDHPNKPAPAS